MSYTYCCRHCVRHNEEAAHNLIFWEPKVKRKQGRCAVTFVDNLKEYTDLEVIDEIRNVMMMRDVWKKIAKSGREFDYSKVSKIYTYIYIYIYYIIL